MQKGIWGRIPASVDRNWLAVMRCCDRRCAERPVGRESWNDALFFGIAWKLL